MSANIQLTILAQLCRQPILNSTGYLIRELRKALGITSGQLAARLGVNKSLILRAELGKIVLDMHMLDRICAELKTVTSCVIDGEYKFVHEDYRQAIGFLVDKMEASKLLDALDLKDASTLKRWQAGKTTPTLEQRRALRVLYNVYIT